MNKALFLDRDGVINLDRGYVYSRENFAFNSGIFELLHAAKAKNYKIVVVTNQSGISRGLYTENDFKTLTRWMLSEFQKREIAVAGVYYCPHAPSENCECRKPKSGMFLQAIADHAIDAARSAMIGDKESDIEAAAAAGVKNTILLASDPLSDPAVDPPSPSAATKAAKQAKNLLATIDFLN